MIGLAQFLQLYGGWGIAALALIAIFYMYKTQGNAFETRHKEYVSLIRETNTSFRAVTDALNKLIMLIENIDGDLKKHDNIIQEVKTVMENCKIRLGQ